MKLPRPLKPEIAETICKQLGISEAQLAGAEADILLVPTKTEKEGFVFDGAFLMMIPVRGHIEQVVVTRNELVDEEGDK